MKRALTEFTKLKNNPIKLGNNPTFAIALFQQIKEHIMQLATLEKLPKWAPHIVIKLNDGKRVYSEPGYTYIFLGGIKETEQHKYIEEYERITFIAITSYDEEVQDLETVTIKLDTIKEISLDN